MHALVIEDELLIAAELELILQQLGFLTIEIASYEDAAVKAALTQKPDLILSDVILEDGTGPNAVARIEAGGVASSVIYITATPSVKGLGGRMVIRKPIDESQLKLMVNKVINTVA